MKSWLQQHLGWILVIITAVTSFGLLAALIEAALIAVILFFKTIFGFWTGLIFYAFTYLVIGVAMMWLTDKFWPASAQASPDDLYHELQSGGLFGIIKQNLAKMAKKSRPLGGLAIAIWWGPIFAPPFFRAIGYKGKSLLVWELISVPVFCIIWYGFYGGGLELIQQLGSKVF